MSAIGKALWYIESHFGEPISLEAVARAAGLSRFSLSRSFTQITGRSFTAYLRGRRLTEAARALAAGAPDILAVALEAGYGSHEAFSRAFRDQFGLTPDQVRARRDTQSLDLLEPIKVPATPTPGIPEPEIREHGALLIAGLRNYFTFEERGGIPALWQRFVPHIGSIPGAAGDTTYGICLPPSAGGDEGFDYVCGVGVASLNDLPEDLVGVRVPARRWAVFEHHDHVSTIGAACAAAGEWFARMGFTPDDDAAQMVEVYGPRFNPQTGTGGCEVWLPLDSKQS